MQEDPPGTFLRTLTSSLIVFYIENVDVFLLKVQFFAKLCYPEYKKGNEKYWQEKIIYIAVELLVKMPFEIFCLH